MEVLGENVIVLKVLPFQSHLFLKENKSPEI